MDEYRMLYSSTSENTFFSSAHETSKENDYKLDHKVNLIRVQMNEIL